ncbi:class II aldolase/adducin family protein [Embleya sp. NBC_00888]|uniref:class II aldolase/adducin family protein n=1 Tax=Embleya sp. NBC_00888 TaxID=2975960 RepID=UPI003869FB69|nr:class II aldolase/adducin family protein [Embleya sp. NBC_00888]
MSERIRAHPGREAAVMLEDERRELCEFGARIVECGLVVGASGNLSVRRGPLVVVTPSGVPLERITPAECVVVDMTGRVVEGTRTPSSETPMHLALYESDPDAGAVVHTHAVFGAVVATTLPVLPAIHYNVLLLGGHDVRVAPYATYGTPELAASVRAALAGGRSAALMANHGGVTLGRDLIEAYNRTRILEWLCEVYVRSLAVGTPNVLTAAELAAVERRMNR